jgi:hypothetical protein
MKSVNIKCGYGLLQQRAIYVPLSTGISGLIFELLPEREFFHSSDKNG